jgi:hypothetical protein
VSEAIFPSSRERSRWSPLNPHARFRSRNADGYALRWQKADDALKDVCKQMLSTNPASAKRPLVRAYDAFVAWKSRCAPLPELEPRDKLGRDNLPNSSSEALWDAYDQGNIEIFRRARETVIQKRQAESEEERRLFVELDKFDQDIVE